MRLILHLGLGKTGTSALQRSLCNLRENLCESGILFPDLGNSRPDHNALSLGLYDYEHLPRGMKYLCGYDAAKAEEQFLTLHRQLQREIEKYRPHTLVLSAENLCRSLDCFGMRNPHEFFLELCPEILVVLYVRKPSARYFSLAQQNLKASGTLLKPRTEGFCRIINAVETAYNFPFKVVPYERTKLEGGDITVDFFSKFLPEALPMLDGQEPAKANESLSAEAMALMQEYRRINHPDADGKFTKDTSRLLRALHVLDTEPDATKPTLRREVSEFIDQSSVDLLWLQEHYGITFDGIDYARVKTADPAETEQFKRITEVRQICEVDEKRKQRITLRALQMLADPTLLPPKTQDI